MVLKQRNTNLDALKGIAAILIVFIHVRIGEGRTGQYVSDIARFGVPVFFLTSGYFVSDASRKKLKHSIFHVFRYIVVAYVLNLVRLFVENHCSFSLTVQAIAKICTRKHLVYWLVMNTTTLSGVSWFLWTLLYCYCIHLLLYEAVSNNRLLFILASVGFCIGLTAQLLFPMVIGKTLGTNNVWMCGLPFYATGLLINRYRTEIRNRFSNEQFVMMQHLA